MNKESPALTSAFEPPAGLKSHQTRQFAVYYNSVPTGGAETANIIILNILKPDFAVIFVSKSQ